MWVRLGWVILGWAGRELEADLARWEWGCGLGWVRLDTARGLSHARSPCHAFRARIKAPLLAQALVPHPYTTMQPSPTLLQRPPPPPHTPHTPPLPRPHPPLPFPLPSPPPLPCPPRDIEAAAAAEAQALASSSSSLPSAPVSIHGSSSSPSPSSPSLPPLHLVVLGHVDAGKSSLMGRLLHDLGYVSARDAHRNQRDATAAGKVRVTCGMWHVPKWHVWGDTWGVLLGSGGAACVA